MKKPCPVKHGGGTKCLLSPTPKNMGGTCPPVPHPNKAHDQYYECNGMTSFMEFMTVFVTCGNILKINHFVQKHYNSTVRHIEPVVRLLNATQVKFGCRTSV